MRKISSKRMLAIMCLFYTGANMAHPFTPTMFTRLGLPDYMFGVALACMSVMGFIMGPFWGKSSDVYGRVRIMVTGCIGYAAGQLMFCYASSIAAVIIARLFSGFFCNATIICSLAYISDTAQGSERSKIMAYQAALMSSFSAGGYLLGGILGDISITLAFYVQSGILLLTGLITGLVLMDANEKDTGKNITDIIKTANPFTVFIKSKDIVTPMMVVLLMSVGTAAFATTCFDNAFNYYIKAEFDFPSTYNGLIKACVGIIGFLANISVCMWLIKHVNARKSMMFLFTVCVSVIAVVLNARTIPVFIAVSICYYIFNSMYLPIQQSLVMSSADTANSGMISGLFNSIRSIGTVLGSLAAGFVYSYGSKLPFVLAAGMFALTLVIVIYNYIQNNVAYGVAHENCVKS